MAISGPNTLSSQNTALQAAQDLATKPTLPQAKPSPKTAHTSRQSPVEHISTVHEIQQSQSQKVGLNPTNAV